MNPKSGKAGSPVPPAAPEEPKEADTAEAGQSAKGTSGKEKTEPEKPYKKDEEKKSWVEIELKDENGQPVPGEKYKVKLPDGSVKEGTLNESGCARIDGIDPGNCKITFPEREDEDVKEA